MAKKATIRWYGKQVSAKMKTAGFRGVRRATAFAQKEIKKAISKPAYVGGGGHVSPRKGSKKARRYDHSKPGQPPRSITGKLRQSIFQSSDRSKMMGSVGTTLKYGAWLEKGANIPSRVPKRKRVMVFAVDGKWVFTRKAKGFKLKARPYIWATVKRHKAKIRAIIFSEMKKAMGSVRVGS